MSLVGSEVPDYVLLDQDAKERSLKDYSGKYVLLFFYPKDLTPGCTIEAQTFRDRMPELEELGVQVLGVSKDDVDSHKKFEEKECLNFPLLADVDGKLVEHFGVWVEKSMFGKKYMGIQRDSFLIGPDGRVLKHYVKVKPKDHPGKVVEDVRGMSLED